MDGVSGWGSVVEGWDGMEWRVLGRRAVGWDVWGGMMMKGGTNSRGRMKVGRDEEEGTWGGLV